MVARLLAWWRGRAGPASGQSDFDVLTRAPERTKDAAPPAGPPWHSLAHLSSDVHKAAIANASPCPVCKVRL